MTKHVKVEVNGDTVVYGDYAALWNLVDMDGEYFTKDTDFGTLGSIPVYYQHGKDAELGLQALGHTVKSYADDVGLWIERQMKRNEAYRKRIEPLIEQGVVGDSTGTSTHLARYGPRDTKGVRPILTWPLAEVSLVLNPAQPRQDSSFTKSVAHMVEPDIYSQKMGASRVWRMSDSMWERKRAVRERLVAARVGR